MKKSVSNRTIVNAAILLMALIPLLFISSCQKEEQLITDSDFNSVNQLKSGTISVYDIDNLISKIENYVTSGDLEPGIANSFLSKLSNAKKIIDKGNEKAANNIFNAVQHQLENLISEGIIDDSIGQELIHYLDLILGEWTCGMPFVDSRDGKVYQTVKIGDQCWLAENLAYLPSVSPPTNESVTEPYYYVYGYNGTSVSDAKETGNYNTYGVLYNWPAATSACPDGWHLPSDDEWKQLEMAIGMSQTEADGNGWRGTDEGTKLKATSGWNNNGNGTDDYDFSALPGGYRHFDDMFHHVGLNGYWWSSTPQEYSASNVLFRLLTYNRSDIGLYSGSKEDGFSVRCVKD